MRQKSTESTNSDEAMIEQLREDPWQPSPPLLQKILHENTAQRKDLVKHRECKFRDEQLLEHCIFVKRWLEKVKQARQPKLVSFISTSISIT